MEARSNWDVSLESEPVEEIEFSSKLFRLRVGYDVPQNKWAVSLSAQKPLIDKWDGELTDEGLIWDNPCESFEEAWLIAGDTLRDLREKEYEMQGSNWHIKLDDFDGKTRREETLSVIESLADRE